MFTEVLTQSNMARGREEVVDLADTNKWHIDAHCHSLVCCALQCIHHLLRGWKDGQ